jgi:hypothetical protein
MNEQPIDIQVVRGSPSSDELAAAVAVVQAALAAAEVESSEHKLRKPVASSWNRNHGLLRTNINAGHGQWSATFIEGLN